MSRLEISTRQTSAPPAFGFRGSRHETIWILIGRRPARYPLATGNACEKD
jgi:hypothetical protein